MRQMIRGMAACVALAAGPVSAATVVVDLDALPAAAGEAVENNTAIQGVLTPAFGSSDEVTLDWDPTGEVGRRLFYWNGQYSGRSAAWCGSSGTSGDCTLDLTVAPGFSLTLVSFMLGGYPNQDRNIDWSVEDLTTSAIVDSGTAAVSGQDGWEGLVGATSTTGFRLMFGPDGFRGGLTEVTYSYAPLSGPGPSVIPLPAAGWLLLAGLGGLAVLGRRRG